MEKIEIEEFVRIKKGKIGKVLSIDENPEWIETTLDKGNVMHISEFKKHSKQLIDLIEVGDFANGKYVEKINEYKDGKFIIALIGIIGEEDIQTILTKESYMANCYEVGGEKC